MTPLLSRDELTELLGELASRLQRRGVTAHVYVVGGAAMALQFDSRRATRDIDSAILSGHGPLTEEVRAIGRERGLASTWLNVQARMYLPTGSDLQQTVVFDHPALTVAAASAEHLLAMKLMAARGSDVDDVRTLVRVLGVADLLEARSVLRTVFPEVELSERARLLLEDVFATER